MTHRTAPRLTSFALAALVTWGVFSGIDTLALEQTSGGLQMSQGQAATQVAAAQPAARG
jgi:hypothetical protein